MLVVDDSAFMRRTVRDVLASEPDIRVVGEATDGADGLEKVARFRPDVVTLDVEMPKMDGLALLRRLMAERPTRVVMLSSLTREGAETTLEALEVGAVDFIQKPHAASAEQREHWGRSLRTKIRAAAAAKLITPATRGRPTVGAVRLPPTSIARNVVVIGASTGGPNALSVVLGGLPRRIKAGVLIVQHMPSGFTPSLANRLNRASPLEVREARDGDRIKDGLALLAPGGVHMEVDRGGIVRLTQGPPVQFVRPSVDVTLRSVAAVYKERSSGVILTGMGRDGLDGCRSVKAVGGWVLTQNAATAVIDSMPRAVRDAGLSDEERPLDEAAAAIVEWAGRVEEREKWR